MDLVLDNNIVIDHIDRREPFYELSRRVCLLGVVGEANTYISVNMLTDLYYLLRKDYGSQGAQDLIENNLSFLQLIGISAEDAQKALAAFFARESIVITKRSKKGDKELDIKPLIFALSIAAVSETELRLECILSAQNPGLNPQLLAAAIETHLPDYKPDFARAGRIEALDEQENPFR